MSEESTTPKLIEQRRASFGLRLTVTFSQTGSALTTRADPDGIDEARAATERLAESRG
jgi:hypothetical protein